MGFNLEIINFISFLRDFCLNLWEHCTLVDGPEKIKKEVGFPTNGSIADHR